MKSYTQHTIEKCEAGELTHAHAIGLAALLDVALRPLSSALQDVLAERTRQDAKWGEQNHEPQYWMGILGEEFVELCQTVNETVFDNGPEERAKGGYANMRAEAVQVAAVAVAFVEYLDRRYGEVEDK